MVFRNKAEVRWVSNFDIYMNGTKLEQVYSIKYLGITLDC